MAKSEGATKKARKQATPEEREARIAARNATQAANSAFDVDFSSGKQASELETEKAQRRNLYVQKLAALRAGVENGDAEANVFYRLGNFSTAAGAAATIKALSKNPEALPGAFDLQPRTLREDGKSVSQLWASYVPAED